MSKNTKQQAGGTFIGLIVGLIIGLGIAVGIALVVTKTSLPFTNKSAPDKTIQLGPNGVTDPNKAMYGKKSPPLVPEVAAPAPTAPNSSSVSDKIEAAKTEASRPTNDEEKWIYYLQAGAFRGIADAENLRAKLALLGFEASISERESDTGMLHRVRIGPFGQTETMNRVRSKLSENGIDVAVVRIGK